MHKGCYTQYMKFLTILLIASAALHSAPAQQKQKPNISASDLEARLLALINTERGLQRVAPLAADEKLSEIARKHSADMAGRVYFKHADPEGRGPRQRLNAAAYSCERRMGENIFLISVYSGVTTRGRRTEYEWNSVDDLAEATMKAWMNSDDHRDNILQVEYDRTGIGVAVGEDNKAYITQMFCR
jgi:uncharacterized protein YkwD